jgi:hypothetical protein
MSPVIVQVVFYDRESLPPRAVENWSLTTAVFYGRYYQPSALKNSELKIEQRVARKIWKHIVLAAREEAPYVSVIRPEWVTAITRKRHGKRVKGVISFKNDCYAGKVHYVAECSNESWRVVQISMPRSGLVSRVGKDGNWNVELPDGWMRPPYDTGGIP